MRTHLLITLAVAAVAAGGIVYATQRSAPVLAQAAATSTVPAAAAAKPSEAPAAAQPAPQAAPAPAAAEESHLVIGLRPLNRLPPPPPPAAAPQPPPPAPMAPVEPNGASSGIRF